MKKSLKAVPVAAKMKSLKTPVKPAKRPNKSNPSPVEEKALKQPSKAKGAVRVVCSVAKKQTATPVVNNDRSKVILLAAVGDAFLPLEDSRVELIVQQREKIKAQQKLSLHCCWGVAPEDSHKAVESGWLALRKVFLDTLCGGEFGGDNASREKWVINFLKHDPMRLMNRYINDPILKKRATSRGKDFFTYAGQIADTKRGRENLFASLKGLKPMANWYILVNWSESPNSTYPPVCLWADSSIHNLLGHEEEPMSFDTIRQFKSRLRLFGPRPRYRFVHTGSGKGRFEVFRN